MPRTANSQATSSDPNIETAAKWLQEIHPPKMFFVATTLGRQAWLDGFDILVSAGTAWRNPGKSGKNNGFDIHVPDAELLFIDSGGFQAAVHYDDKYPYDARELFEWAKSIDADFVAGMDWACEEADALREAPTVTVTADTIASVPERIERSIEDQIRQAEVHEEGNWPFTFVPTVQGYSVSDYRYCARRLRQAGVARPYMGLGSVCKRDSPQQIFRILQACQEELPHTEFHLFGATRRVWKDKKFYGYFVSADTHAWAVSHPDGGWPNTKEEKEEAFEYFKNDIQDVQKQIASIQPLDQHTDPLSTVLCELQVDKCACGTKIPAYGTDFETNCRHCEQKKLNRWARNMHAIETTSPPETIYNAKHEQQNITEFHNHK